MFYYEINFSTNVFYVRKISICIQSFIDLLNINELQSSHLNLKLNLYTWKSAITIIKMHCLSFFFGDSYDRL